MFSLLSTPVGRFSSFEEKKSEVGTTETPKRERRAHIPLSIIITAVTRRDFRRLFGIGKYEKFGHFLEDGMNPIIHRYGNWLDYPSGNHTLRGHDSRVCAIAISEDGSHLYSSGSDRSIITWDLLNNTMEQRWKAHSNWIRSLAVHSDRLVSSSDDRTIKVWNLSDNDSDDGCEMITEIQQRIHYALCVRFTLDGSSLISACSDGSLRIYSSENGDCLKQLDKHIGRVLSLCIIDDRTLLSGGQDESIRMWNRLDYSSDFVQSDSLDRLSDEWINRPLMSVEINCDRTWLVCNVTNKLLVFRWPMKSLFDKPAIVMRRTVTALAFHPQIPDLLAFANFGSNTIQCVNLRSMAFSAEMRGHTIRVTQLIFSPDGCRILTCARDTTVRTWDVLAEGLV